ncbi:MAG TPA: acetate--CoA ligase family protein, partial [Telluria sp.]|nr:acetate--CoA ligase family protein [Telluria sp.]
MSIRNLHHLFAPASVAVVGASEKPNSVGTTVLHNLLTGGFKGDIYPVNPKHALLEGRVVYHSIGALPAAPELAVICTPADTVPGIIAELGKRGTRAAIILTAGLSAQTTRSGATLTQAVLDAGRPYTMRILGPNCVGLLVPGIGLNASFALGGAQPGRIAFVSQSGALVTAVLDWANERGIGFSKFISMGDSADVDFGDVLDYLASDPDTGAILMYIEDVRHARKFMSAARAAARGKPTLVLKAGRVPEGARAAASHTGALAGADDVYDAAIRRAGMLRVLSTDALFGAAETLSRAHTLEGESLAILTNGGGPGVIATDALIAGGGKLASLSTTAMEHLNAVLPPTWSHANPVDIVGDAPVERYGKALQILLDDGRMNPILFMHAPTALVPSAAIASALAPIICSTNRTVLSCWLGGQSVAQARRIFSASGIPVFDTPEEAVGAFLQMVQYRQNQALLMQVPPAISEIGSDRSAAQAIVRAAQAVDRSILSEPETKAVLAAYNIPVAATRVAASLEEALDAAAQIGFPVALKIISPDITHKSEVGGVALDLD